MLLQIGVVLVLISTGSAESIDLSGPDPQIFANAILRAVREAKGEIKGPPIDKLIQAILGNPLCEVGGGGGGTVGGNTGGSSTGDVKSCGGTAAEAPCVFPFIYRGETYEQCMSVDHDQPWCATQSGDYATHGKWGNCNCKREGSFQSKNYPARGIALRSTEVHLEPSFWRLVSPGLGGQSGSVSFQSIANSNRYLRHSGFVLYENQNDGSSLFKLAATFYVRNNKYFDGYDAYESVNYAGRFIRHSGFQLKINTFDGSESFKSDASFKSGVVPHTCGGSGGAAACVFPYTYRGVVYSTCTTRDHNQPWCSTQEGDYSSHGKWGNCNCPNSVFSLVSKNNPSRGIGLLGTTGYIIPMFWRLVSPGLDGQEGSVSFQSIVDGEKYLRHSGGYLLHENTNDNSALFRKDATFYNHMNKYFSGYDAYESVNYPNYFIHHSGFRMKISEDDGSDLFKKDASFKEVRMSSE